MGEVMVLSSEGGGDAAAAAAVDTPEFTTNGDSAAATATGVVRWEKFLPRMLLRVLLVEADDSTRHIITALLRKCSYKVVAVSDGLKAWEVLKGRPRNIDLILTEVELPSISGFALLTLIAEHKVCKNIPVIMMSANDSVSTVYKCMLRGAADFLVKPVRKNELQNLWQHVWRRQASTSCGNGPNEESDAQPKVEATAENNATSNRSSGYMACIKRNRECIEKGSDAQSSCTKPDIEAEAPHTEQAKDLPHPQWAKSPSEAITNTQEKGMIVDINRWERVNVVVDNNNNNNPSREVMDLIGSFNSYPKSSYRSSLNFGAHKIDHPSPVLDLSLKRSHPSSSVNQFADERHMLKQSDVSAFSRYINRTQPTPPSGSASISNQPKDYGTNSDKPSSKNAIEYNNTHMISSHKNTIGQNGQSQSQTPKQRVFPVPVPVSGRGLRFENPCATDGSVLPPLFCVQPGLAPMQSPCSSVHQEPSSFQANPYYTSNPEARRDPTVDRKSSDMAENRQDHNTETLEDRATDHSASSGFCNGGTLNIGSGSNGHVNLVSDGNSIHRSIQREAALNKFRMKRKDRCFEKKVRYESRKKLAEKRPRVKGQFVRQVQTDNPSPMEAGILSPV